MGSKLILTTLTFTLSSFLFLETFSSEKQEFIYKTVKGHDIKADIFSPEMKDKCPVLIFLGVSFLKIETRD